MNVVVLIDGREALPVRAIPMLTNWQTMTPDEVAQVLAGVGQFNHHFKGLFSYRLESGSCEVVDNTYWESWMIPEFEAISERIKQSGVSEAVGYQQWRAESLLALPASVFVWKDDFSERYIRKFGPAGHMQWMDDGGVLSPEAKARKLALNFNPFINSDLFITVMEGFDTQAAAVPLARAAVESASDSVQASKAGPLPLTTGDIAFCFAGLRWNEKQWKKPLGDKPKWLAACIAIPGVRGVSETRWNPVFIGAALERQGHAKQNKIRARFQTQPQLLPWFDAWKTYEADNLDTE